MVLKYEGNQIINSCTGDSFEEFQEQFQDDERAFAYLRINVGTGRLHSLYDSSTAITDVIRFT